MNVEKIQDIIKHHKHCKQCGNVIFPSISPESNYLYEISMCCKQCNELFYVKKELKELTNKETPLEGFLRQTGETNEKKTN